jgi:hypothetical protein
LFAPKRRQQDLFHHLVGSWLEIKGLFGSTSSFENQLHTFSAPPASEKHGIVLRVWQIEMLQLQKNEILL